MSDPADTEVSLRLVAAPAIEKRILVVRKRQVILDEDLAELYGVETRSLVQAVRRNQARFPGDFMFQLNREEHDVLRSQTVISKPGRGGRRYRPYAFTEQGVAMLSSVLHSERATQVGSAESEPLHFWRHRGAFARGDLRPASLVTSILGQRGTDLLLETPYGPLPPHFEEHLLESSALAGPWARSHSRRGARDRLGWRTTCCARVLQTQRWSDCRVDPHIGW